MLESAGLIELKEDFDDGVGTPDDIAENPKNLEFDLIDDWTAPRVLQDVDMALIGNTIALEGGLNVLEDAIYREETDESNRTNINVIAVKEDRQNEEQLQKLGEVYHDPEVQEYIEEEFDGTKVEVDLSADDVWSH
ncbi:substrate-binding component of an ABC superfamily methionine transporter [Tetragenococcus muriaticus PMC-11-5]|uniref:Substrate-binding component of an ABC superfamily methionine transporter n=1 Tax=Tetragenococcus muriaticus PMC-11-5 TaxID=1302649 RepID=A0A091C9E4_9ENTE|nr:MetQ/NlpA family ABC transporter substrate-binding protein [Tetragenococcus muriaticus]KFN93719.1 substrate-binding component of an ABC superfamily methionine transporter [Tetragenococcus muriaticus PMC-11-5]